MQIEISLFGKMSLSVAGQPFTRFATHKIRALIAYLAVEGERAHSRSALSTLLWPDYSTSDSLRNLRHALYRLRRDLGADIFDRQFEVTRHSVRLRGEQLQVDVVQFVTLLEAGQLEAALALYQGGFLEGLHLADAEPFEAWQTVRGEQYHQQALQALQQLTDLYEQQGEYDKMQRVALRHVALEGWHEEAQRQLMRAYALGGQPSLALAQYEACRALLLKELGVAPSAETEALYQQIRRGQLQPPDRSFERRRQRCHHLPAVHTPLIGRDSEATTVVDALLGDCRLLTVIGAGGSGKTRLAIEAAERLALVDRFSPQGIYFVSLATVERADRVAGAIASALQMSLQPQQPADAQLIDYLRAKSLLLIVDNFEHLADAASLLAQILAEAPDVRLLATSRLPLNLKGEQRIHLGGLTHAKGEGDDFEAFAAHQLFVTAARLVQADFEPEREAQRAIAAICRLLHGLPLALEMAAAWIRMLSPAQIVQQLEQGIDFLASPLRDLPARHRSMRAVFDYSWQLLSEQERATLAQLAHFRGDFGLEAALRVTNASVLELANLLDWSLLQRGSEGRYRLHELLRQFAAEQLQQDHELLAATEAAHSRYYLNVAGRQTPLLYSPEFSRAKRRLEQALDNIRLAWERAVERDRFDMIVQAAEGFSRFLSLTGNAGEAVERLRNAADRCNAEQPQIWLNVLLARSLYNIGRLSEAHALAQSAVTALGVDAPAAWRAGGRLTFGEVLLEHGDYPNGLQQLQRALQLFEEQQDLKGQSDALLAVGQHYWHLAAYDEAQRYMLRALPLVEQLGDSVGVAGCYRRLGITYYRQSMYAEALEALQRSLQIARRLDNTASIAAALNNLGNVYSDLEQHGDALACYQQAMAIDEEIGNRFGIAKRLVNIGIVHMRMQQYEAGLKVTRQAQPLLQAINHRSGVALTTGNIGVFLWRLGETQQALDHHLQALAIDEELGNWDCVARHLGNVGVVRVELGMFDEAMDAYERGYAVHQTLNIPYFFCELLVRKARLHLLLGEPDAAAPLAAEGLRLAEQVGRSETIADARELLAELAQI